MPAPEIGPLDRLLPPNARLRDGAGVDAADRPTPSAVSVCRRPYAARSAAARGTTCGAAPCGHPDAPHGPALYRKPSLSRRQPGHQIYPYLVRDLAISRSNHVWAADITYIPMRRGFVYLFAVLDWASRRVLAWRLSTTLTTDFCLDAVQDAVGRYGPPAIFNTDQGCQFTSHEFTGLLTHHGIQISMDGKGCWRDNVFVERLWKSIKYEEVYVHAYETVNAAHQGLERDLAFYNQIRPHQALGGQTPDQVYDENLTTRRTAA